MLNVLLPVCFGIVFIFLSHTIKNFFVGKVFLYLGRNTVPIMFLHKPVNDLLLGHFNYGLIMYVFIGHLLFLLNVLNELNH